MKDESIPEQEGAVIVGQTFTVGLSTHDRLGNELMLPGVEIKLGDEAFECQAEAALKLAALIVTMAKRAIAAR